MDQGTYHILLYFCDTCHQNLHAQKPSLILLTVDNTPQLLVYFKSAVKYMARVFATLRLQGRPGHDSCQRALWDCFGEHIFRVVTKISSCRVNTTSRWGIKRLGSSFGSIFLLFSNKSSQGPLS